MLDPISLATSAFAAIKSGVEVGKQLNDLSHHIIKFVKQMSAVEEEHKKKKSSWFTSSNEEALDTYFKLKKVHDMENQLRELFMWYGAPNAWDEFIAIRSDIRKKKQKEKERKAKERAELIKIASYIGVGILVVAAIVVFALNYKMLTSK
ncbi:MAG: hypothetical protein CBB97_12410 [Candidatus Endolissoclinum sp. TMED37]|nr:MAG: hypothetical protein CBB97_12410 [Candidatus Endolissoclinum sp. TMED37]